MGAGVAQVSVLLALTVIGLPLFFFGLMAALDRFEQKLSGAPRTAAAGGAGAATEAASESSAPVVTLPVANTASTAAPSSSSLSPSASKPAAAI